MRIAISINHLTVLYGAHTALMDITCEIPVGVLCAIVGPNGAGKSTLLNAIVGLVKPFAGTIHIQEKKNTAARNGYAYVPQRAAINWQFPISVYDVVMMGRYAHIGFFKKPQKKDHDIVCEALTAVEMFHHKDVLIGALSGGQQQRVFVARALAQQASILLLDEPFAGVDVATEALCIELFAQLCSQGITVIMVHHDLVSIASYADWAILLNRTLIKAGSIESVFCNHHIVQAYGRMVAGIAREHS